ncbi:hypothetical protein PC123_g2869 [Phytophthora cactorum]|nr:hypothetical protein PC123_g2869 [Phytophthora cactorum]
MFRREKPAPALPARTPPVTPQWIPSTGVLPPHQPPFVLQKVRSKFGPLSSDEPLATEGWQEAVSLHLHPPEKAKRERLAYLPVAEVTTANDRLLFCHVFRPPKARDGSHTKNHRADPE